MFFDRLFNDSNAPVLERVLEFTAQRHRLIAESVVNISTPGYRQKDLSPDKFQEMLRQRVDERRSGGGGVSFDDIQSEVEDAHHGILFPNFNATTSSRSADASPMACDF